MVLRGHRRPERRHHAVAHVVDQRAAVVQDRVGHQAQVVVEHVDHPVDGKGLRERREPPEVPEQHGPGERLRGIVLPPSVRSSSAPTSDSGTNRANTLRTRSLLEIVQRFAVEARVHARAEDHRVERFGQEVLGTHLDASDDAVSVIDATDHDHG